MIKKIAVIDGEGSPFYKVKDKFGSYGIETMTTDQITDDFVKNLKDTVIMTESRAQYDKFYDMNKRGIIHFGLRSFDIRDVVRMRWLNLGNNVFLMVSIPEKYDIKNKFRLFLTTDFEKLDIPIFNPKDSRIFTMDDGIDIFDEFDGKPEIGYDFESAGFPNCPNFEITGLGISCIDKHAYFDFRYYSSEEVKNKFMERFIKFTIDNHKCIWVYNKAFELNAFYRVSGKVIDMHDMMALAKCDDMSGTLKYIAQYYLSIPSWDDDEAIYSDAAEDMFWTADSYDQFLKLMELHKSIRDGYGLNSIDYATFDKNKFLKENRDKFTLEFIKTLRKEDPRNIDDYALLSRTCLKNYEKVMELGQDLNMLKKYWGSSFATTPKDLVGFYCQQDAYYTVRCVDYVGNVEEGTNTTNGEVAEE